MHLTPAYSIPQENWLLPLLVSMWTMTSSRFEQATAMGIKAIFILLRDSDMAHQHDPISWEKLHELCGSPINCILGLILNLHRMTVSTLPEFDAVMHAPQHATGTKLMHLQKEGSQRAHRMAEPHHFQCPVAETPIRQHLLLSHCGIAPQQFAPSLHEPVFPRCLTHFVHCPPPVAGWDHHAILPH